MNFLMSSNIFHRFGFGMVKFDKFRHVVIPIRFAACAGDCSYQWDPWLDGCHPKSRSYLTSRYRTIALLLLVRCGEIVTGFLIGLSRHALVSPKHQSGYLVKYSHSLTTQIPLSREKRHGCIGYCLLFFFYVLLVLLFQSTVERDTYLNPEGTPCTKNLSYLELDKPCICCHFSFYYPHACCLQAPSFFLSYLIFWNYF